jgi:hypothetical protein
VLLQHFDDPLFRESALAHVRLPEGTDSTQKRGHLRGAGQNRCKIALYQDSSDQWIRIEITYSSAILKNYGSDDLRSIQATNLISPAIIKESPVILSRCTFVTETPHAEIANDKSARVSKRTSVIFRKSAILEDHRLIGSELTETLEKIETETDLIQKDNLARGALIDSVRLWARLRKSGNSTWWSTDTDTMKIEFGENDPTEYWGEIGLNVSDFIAGSTRYPWIPSDISKIESPFDD